jgi:hypothetical protein
MRMKAHQITTRLGCRHAGVAGDVAQHHRALAGGQGTQQTRADFDRLDSLALLNCFSIVVRAHFFLVSDGLRAVARRIEGATQASACRAAS